MKKLDKSQVREVWIDVLRGIAILAVVLDHAIFLYPSYYLHPLVQSHLYFSIIFFVYLSGITNALSSQRKHWQFPLSFFKFWINKLGFILTYVIASIISTRYYHGKFFNFHGVVVDLMYFSAQRPYYFFALLFRLYFLFPFLYTIWMLSRKKGTYITLIIITGLSFLLYFIPQNSWLIWFFGYSTFGAYFFTFYLGIVSAGVRLKWNKFTSGVTILTLLLTEIYIISKYGHIFRNVPIIPLFIWSLSLLFNLKLLLYYFGINNYIAIFFSYLGKHSYYIFLFHFLIISIFSKRQNYNKLDIFLSIIVAIFLPIAIESVVLVLYKTLTHWREKRKLAIRYLEWRNF